MRCPTMLLFVLAFLLVIDAAVEADDTPLDLADVAVTVKAGSTLLEGAVVMLDLNNNGIWEEHLEEPRGVTGADGVAIFSEIVSTGGSGPGSGDQDDIIDGYAARILTGNLRGTVGARDVQFDFVLPSGNDAASLGLYDLRGRRLAEVRGAGDLTLTVPGGLSSGVYFVRLSADPAAPATHRITSVGQRAQTIRAQKVSVAEAVAAGWADSRQSPAAQKSRDGALQTIGILVSHIEHGAMNQTETIVVGSNEINVDLPESPDGFVFIPPGTFMMGSPENELGRSPGEVQHKVSLTKSFYLSKYAVTKQLWHEVMGGEATTSQLPKVDVSWDMAVVFCNELSKQAGLDTVYAIHGPAGDVTWNMSANGYRLPTEAEWEYACRAGSMTAFANGPITHIECEPLDSNLEALGWYCGNRTYEDGPAAVGLKQPNAWGLYDMHGNVHEWLWCGWRFMTAVSQVDPVGGAFFGTVRMFRGGNWFDHASSCRASSRGGSFPDNEYESVGFRLARSAFQESKPGTPNALMVFFRTIYPRRDIDAYTEILSEDFLFVTNTDTIAPYGYDEEIEITSRMFQGIAGSDGTVFSRITVDKLDPLFVWQDTEPDDEFFGLFPDSKYRNYEVDISFYDTGAPRRLRARGEVRFYVTQVTVGEKVYYKYLGMADHTVGRSRTRAGAGKIVVQPLFSLKRVTQ